MGAPMSRVDSEVSGARRMASERGLTVPDMATVRRRVAAVKVGASVGDPAVTGAIFVESLGMGASDRWPAEVTEAFEHLGLADKYGTGTRAGISSLIRGVVPPDSHAVTGLTSSVKGTVLEQKVASQVAATSISGLPDGVERAVLAEKLNQPGWDIDLLDSQGDHIEYLQVKAGSLETVREHLARYPAIDHVAVTHDVAVAAADSGAGGHLLDAGVDGSELTEHVSDSMDNLTMAHGVHEVVPEFALVAIAAMVVYRCTKGESLDDSLQWGKERAIDAGLANAAALLVVLVCGDPLILRPAVSMSVRFARMRSRRAAQAGIRIHRLRESLAAMHSEGAARV